jgi:hypothetical protein
LKQEKDLALIQLGKADLRDIKRLEQLKIKDLQIEEAKPSLLQHPIVITTMVILGIAGGVYIGAQF